MHLVRFQINSSQPPIFLVYSDKTSLKNHDFNHVLLFVSLIPKSFSIQQDRRDRFLFFFGNNFSSEVNLSNETGEVKGL